MRFHVLLRKLYNVSGSGLEFFDSRDVGSALKMPVKEASNGLRRLHQMGFLKRMRIKRSCFSKTLKPCFKGFMYLYSVSKQGLSYVEWRKNQKPVEDYAYLQLMTDVLSHLPGELIYRLNLVGLARIDSKYRGPARSLRMFDNEMMPFAYLTRKIKNITSEIEQLKSENQKLKLKNEMLTKNNDALEKWISDQKKLLMDSLKELIKTAGKLRNSEAEAEFNQNVVVLTYIINLMFSTTLVKANKELIELTWLYREQADIFGMAFLTKDEQYRKIEEKNRWLRSENDAFRCKLGESTGSIWAWTGQSLIQYAPISSH